MVAILDFGKIAIFATSSPAAVLVKACAATSSPACPVQKGFPLTNMIYPTTTTLLAQCQCLIWSADVCLLGGVCVVVGWGGGGGELAATCLLLTSAAFMHHDDKWA